MSRVASQAGLIGALFRTCAIDTPRVQEPHETRVHSARRSEKKKSMRERVWQIEF